MAGISSGDHSISAIAKSDTITNSITIASTKVLSAILAAGFAPSLPHCFHHRSTHSAQTITGKASTCKLVSSNFCKPTSTSTISEISTPRKPTRVIRSLSRLGVTTIPTSTDEHSTTGPITGPIWRKASAISIGVNRPNALSPMKLRASTTRNDPSGRTISRFEGFSPQIA